MVYYYETKDFTFSSNNPQKVENVKALFEVQGITVEGLKNGDVEKLHTLMVNLTCWGQCSITNSYWRARELRQEIKEAYVSNFKKGSISEFWAKGVEGDEYSRERVKELTGWLFK